VVNKKQSIIINGTEYRSKEDFERLSGGGVLVALGLSFLIVGIIILFVYIIPGIIMLIIGGFLVKHGIKNISQVRLGKK